MTSLIASLGLLARYEWLLCTRIITSLQFGSIDAVESFEDE